MLGYEIDGVLVGCIGIQALGDGQAIVRHIVVDGTRRKRGIGRALVEHARQHVGIRTLVAETDHEAVGFYVRCGFAIDSLGERYPGVERFQCTLGEPAPGWFGFTG